MQFFIHLLSAQVQFTQVIPYLAIFVSLTGAIVSVSSLSLKVKQHKRENELKMASKIFVKEEFSKLEVMQLNAEKDILEFKADNIREHEQIRKDVNSKLDLIIKLVS